jgi:stage V sporulation protein B
MKQSRLTGAISVTAAQAVVLVLGYVTHLWIGRVLGPASYGIYGVVLSVQTIFGLILTLGVPIAISRFVAQDEQHAQNTLWQALRIQGVIAIIVATISFSLSSFIAQLLNDPNLTNYMRFVSLVLLVQAGYPIFIQFLSGLHFFNRQAALTTIYAVAKLAGALSLIYFFGVYGAFAGFAVGGIVAAIIGWLWTRKVGGNKKRRLPIKSFLSFAGIYVLILAGLQLLISLDLFMVKAILKDNVQAGYYNAAVTLSRISYLLLQALSFILLPSVSKLTKPGASHEKAVTFIRDTLRYLIALIIPSVALAATTSKSLILLFFSEQYISASSVLSILMIGLGSLAFYLLLVNISAGAGKPKVGLFITIFLLGISGTLGMFLIPRFGIIGAAWQTTITGIIGLILLASYTFKTFKIPVPYKSTINIVLASVIAILPTYIWEVHPFALPLQYLVLGALYILALYLLREITDEDRQLVANLHPSLKRLAPKI